MYSTETAITIIVKAIKNIKKPIQDSGNQPEEKPLFQPTALASTTLDGQEAAELYDKYHIER